jgi:ubiquinone/menaquinone biosynthesis C-methylase UbiE
MKIQNWNKPAQNIEFNLEIDKKAINKYFRKKNKILDYGCGYGRITNELYVLGYENIIGVDSSLEFINRGKKEFSHLTLQHNNTGLLPFKNSEFDGIILCAVLTCIPSDSDQKELVKEIKRVLKPGGIVILSEFKKSESIKYSNNGCFCSDFDIKMKHYEINEIENLLKNFKKIKIEIIETKTIKGTPIESINYIGKNLTNHST